MKVRHTLLALFIGLFIASCVTGDGSPGPANQDGPFSILSFSGEITGKQTVNLQARIQYGLDLSHLNITFDPDDGSDPQDVQLEESDGDNEYVGSLEYKYSENTTFPVMPSAKVTNSETGESDSSTINLKKVTTRVEKTGDGQGTVTVESGIFSSVEIINCGPGCANDSQESIAFADGSKGLPVILSATAADGSVFAGWSGDISGGEGCDGTGDCEMMMNQDRTVTATFEADGTGNTLETGTYTLPALVPSLEAFALLFQQVTTSPGKRYHRNFTASQMETAFGNISGTYPAAFSGEDSVIVVDLLTNEKLMGIDASSISPLYGVAAVATEPAHESATFVIYGAGGTGDIDTQGGGFFSTGLGAYYDAVPAGGDVFSGTYIKTGGSTMLQTYSSENGYYSFPSGHGHVYGGSFEDNRSPVSAWVPDNPNQGWPATIGVGRNAQTLASSVFLIKTDGSADPVRVADVGQDARKVRCDAIEGTGNFLCGVTVFGEDQVALFTWDGETNPASAGTVDVGDGPVNLDVKQLSNGNVGLVTTGFNDNTVSVMELMPGGSVVSNTKSSVPAACNSPGHAKFIRDAESLKIIGTCYDSGNYFIMESGL